jgi:PAS domain S-box-containing protein
MSARIFEGAAPAQRTDATTAARDHFVQFYEADHTLVVDVARYIRNALESGTAAIIIARPEHVTGILEQWAREQFDYRRAHERDQLVILDAAQTLRRLMLEGRPDEALFEQTVGQIVTKALDRFGDLAAFGEMVALLWAEERQAAAIQLEEYWNRLQARQRFSLYCAYPMKACADASMSEAFRHVCHAHSHVIPAEGFRNVHDEVEAVSLIAQLQQRAAALERELQLRREMEGRLADRERELSDFLDNATVGLHRVGPDGTILWANRAELDLLGYEPGEYIGRNIIEFHADRGVIDRILEVLASGKVLRDQPARLRCKDGTIRHVLISSSARIENGELINTRCFTRDISDRWLAQEALRERSAVLHLAMQGARMGYWVSDLETRTILCSHELATLLGVSNAADWPIDAFIELMHPGDRTAFREAFEAAIEGSAMLLCEFRVPTGTAGWRWFEARGEAVYGDSGRAVRFYGICTDITARRRDQAVLTHLAAVADSTHDAVVSNTLDGIVTSWNASARRLFGYSPEEVVGRPLAILIPPERQEEEARILARLRAGERIERYSTTRIAKDGTCKHVSISISPVRDGEGNVIGASKFVREIPTP